jgi:hypothetical protein
MASEKKSASKKKVQLRDLPKNQNEVIEKQWVRWWPGPGPMRPSRNGCWHNRQRCSRRLD